ncbi:uncharacterized protein BT62DRAFT_917120 [Guyanagaster necrorhizus]|uniref:Uncharacterized protein n=1 Tax=Guyanagaster necrorhizus TaxID=856835 RepID=A0A9P8AWM8_9AGAR|nr:uncharacterized protein BT62DRAFT_917120 [Guyanagaster necrorhizus MCA 3950]KAG7450829.1 hypothetical protein BT62DRAFT_917120 [Guyanagaster necrorhizus MCA 3950]
MSGLTYQLHSTGNVIILGDWSIGPSWAAYHAQKNIQDESSVSESLSDIPSLSLDSMALDGGHADNSADEYAVVNPDSTNKLSTGDRSTDHPRVNIGLQESDPVMPVEHNNPVQTESDSQRGHWMMAEALISDGTKKIIDRCRKAMGLASQPVPSSSSAARPQDKGKIVNYYNKLTTLPGFTSNDFNSDNMTVAINNSTAINEPSMEKVSSQSTTAQKTLEQHKAHSVKISEVLEQLMHLNQPSDTAANIAPIMSSD